MKNVQISELLFKKMYAYFVEQQEEYYDDIKSGIEEKAERIFARYEYSKKFLDKFSDDVKERVMQFNPQTSTKEEFNQMLSELNLTAMEYYNLVTECSNYK